MEKNCQKYQLFVWLIESLKEKLVVKQWEFILASAIIDQIQKLV